MRTYFSAKMLCERRKRMGKLDFFEKFAILLQACDRGYKAVTYDTEP